LSYSYGVTSDKKATDCTYNQPSNTSSLIISTDGKKQQKCFVKITDDSGTFTRTLTADINVSADQFNHFTDNADKANDYTANLGGWDGLIVNENKECKIKVSAENGTITLASANTNLTARKSENGPILYKEVEGDFLIQAKVVSLDGQERRNTPAYNEGGIIVLDQQARRGQEIIHLGVFPNYNCGNMLTHVGPGRPQFPRSNAWNYDPYLQIERIGSTFYVRTSKDGKSWTDMPGAPIHAPQMDGKKLKVGLYQTTYSNNHSWVSFDEFNLWQKK
jgi:regulation of enolase protein 1 (concanavalin A-like superfamily)